MIKKKFNNFFFLILIIILIAEITLNFFSTNIYGYNKLILFSEKYIIIFSYKRKFVVKTISYGWDCLPVKKSI